MAAIYQLGFTPFQNAYLPSGSHNLLPLQIRKHLPKHFDYSFNNIFSSQLFCFNLHYFPLTIKPTPNQIFNSSRNKVYKIITSHKNINDLENLKDFDFENEVVFNGLTALQLAASTNYVEALDFLIKRKKINVNSHSGKYDKTPLHLAVEYGNMIAIKYLIANGGNPNELDAYGFDSYDKAEFRGNYQFRDLVYKINQYKKSKNQKEIKNLNSKIMISQKNENDLNWYNNVKPSSLIKIHFVENILEPDYIDLRNFQLFFLKDTII